MPSFLLLPVYPLVTTQMKQDTINEKDYSPKFKTYIAPNINFQKNNAINTPFPFQSIFKTLLGNGQIN